MGYRLIAVSKFNWGAASLGLGLHQWEQREGFNHLTALIQNDNLQAGAHCLQGQRGLQTAKAQHKQMCHVTGSIEGPSQQDTLQLDNLLRHVLMLSSQVTGRSLAHECLTVVP